MRAGKTDKREIVKSEKAVKG